ncbi:MAG: hypothetical protein KJ755_21115 [Alphaproteobacteria bacterium]|nr:hypothetical protein [Gammaproteobacteria bacterium]MBU0852232.1 hypothetical protein [Gammaproteobacteria bacterium]MBU1461716.1 hypothetical protein [Gammaproteobacteria bacterium]MBU1772775.1 hypothetical protein [Gammaproteobacteria bacterium]MBU2329826.1 hypothetical protein [Alphaproteobacteria bacterium]|tara:strand:- start:5702 stop:6064 length:363 start_codon:yes stop_codon:yes gene_type:complete
MCGKVLQKVHSLHKKLDPIGGKYLDAIPQSLGLPTVDELGAGMGGNPTIDGKAVSQSEYNASITGSVVAPTEAPTEVDAGVLAARDDERRRRASAAGQSSTILSSNLGSAPTGRKTLLGA